MEKRVMMLIVGLIVIVGLPAMALCQEETAEVIEAAPADTGPPFVETEVYEADMAVLQGQIEALAPIPITQADIPLTISTPGSYYLTEDVTSSGTAITIMADDVTIDLAGFALVGPDTGTSCGINMNGRSNVEIRNGTVRDFSYGILESDDILGRAHRIINVRAISNMHYGILLSGKGHLVKDCTVSENGDSAIGGVYSIKAGDGSTVTGNTVSNNGDSASSNVFGINAGDGSTITGNSICNNGKSASSTGSYIVYGIFAGDSSTVRGNTVNNNGELAKNDVYGIRASYGSTIMGNSICNNGDSADHNVIGICAFSGCTVASNTVSNNGASAGGYIIGITAFSGCTVTGNTVNNNGDDATDSSVWGIRLNPCCLVDQNTAYDNGTGAASATNMTIGVGGCVYGINVAP